jgi:hypothetical protein
MSFARRTTIGLDHAGLFASALDTISSQYELLGFCLTPQSQHASPPAPGQPAVTRGTANRCAMLEHGYIELLAVVDPKLDGLGVPEALARYAGIHILAFQTDNPDAAQARLQATGMNATQAYLQRSIDTPDGAGLAHFTQVRTPPEAMPEGRIFMLQHHTRELVWQPSYLSHPNTAVALLDIVVAVTDLAEAQQRYSRYFDCEAETTAGKAVYTLAAGSFTLMEPDALKHDYPEASIPTLPFPAVLVIGVLNLEITAQVLMSNKLPFAYRAGQLVVAPQLAGGAVLVFRQIG